MRAPSSPWRVRSRGASASVEGGCIGCASSCADSIERVHASEHRGRQAGWLAVPYARQIRRGKYKSGHIVTAAAMAPHRRGSRKKPKAKTLRKAEGVKQKQQWKKEKKLRVSCMLMHDGGGFVSLLCSEASSLCSLHRWARWERRTRWICAPQ